MRKLFIISHLFLFLYGQTGKIAGYVTDASTKEPLVGVSIIVLDKGIGADTDSNGRFIIINVPIGTYDINNRIKQLKLLLTNNVLLSIGAESIKENASNSFSML